MFNWSEYPGIIDLVIDKVNNENIKYLRVDRYDGFLFDDFDISKFCIKDKQIEVASDFARAVLDTQTEYNYRLFFTNEFGFLFCRFFNTLEQIFEDPDNINRVNKKYVDEAFNNGLITFKQYNTYVKNHGGK